MDITNHKNKFYKIGTVGQFKVLYASSVLW